VIAQQTGLIATRTENSAHQKDQLADAVFTAAELRRLVAAPRPEDVASPRALVFALHASISGPAGPFDWTRFRSLFLPTSRIGEAGTEPGGKPHITFQSVNDWIFSVQELRPEVSVGETVYKVHIEQYGSIANAFYSHNSVTSEQGGQTSGALTAAKCYMMESDGG